MAGKHPCQRDVQYQRCPVARPRADIESTAEQGSSLLHAEEAESSFPVGRLRCRRGIEANSIVLNRRLETPGVGLHADAYRPRLRVAGAVADRLLKHAEDRHFQMGGQIFVQTICRNGHCYAPFLQASFGYHADGGDQAQVIQDRRTQIQYEPAGVRQRTESKRLHAGDEARRWQLASPAPTVPAARGP